MLRKSTLMCIGCLCLCLHFSDLHLRISCFISPVDVMKINDLKWYEIDDEADKKYMKKNIIP